jgi:hypothetical protein
VLDIPSVDNFSPLSALLIPASLQPSITGHLSFHDLPHTQKKRHRWLLDQSQNRDTSPLLYCTQLSEFHQRLNAAIATFDQPLTNEFYNGYTLRAVRQTSQPSRRHPLPPFRSFYAASRSTLIPT